MAVLAAKKKFASCKEKQGLNAVGSLFSHSTHALFNAIYKGLLLASVLGQIGCSSKG
jgi:hypothetical protein